MFRLNELLAVPHVLTVGEVSWRLSRPTLADLGAIEAQVARHHHSADAAANTTKEGTPSACTPRQIAGWVASREGTRFVLWLATQRHHPELRITEAAELVEQITKTEIESHSAVQVLRDVEPAADVPLDWSNLFRRLAQRYGWTPTQIVDLTLLQAQAICGRRRNRRRWLTRREAEHWRQDWERERAAATAVVPPLTASSDREAKFRRSLPMIYGPFEVAALAQLTVPVPSTDRRMRRRTTRAAKRDRDPQHEARTHLRLTTIESVLQKQCDALFVRLRGYQTCDANLRPYSSARSGTARFE